MDGDQFIPPPPPPEEPAQRRTGMRKIAATALLSVGLLAGTGVGSFVIAHAASSTTASSGATLTATTASPSTTAPATKTPSTTMCPNMGRPAPRADRSLPSLKAARRFRRVASPPLEGAAVPGVEDGIGRILWQARPRELPNASTSASLSRRRSLVRSADMRISSLARSLHPLGEPRVELRAPE